MTRLIGIDLTTSELFFVRGGSNALHVFDAYDRLTRVKLGEAASWINDAAGTVTLYEPGTDTPIVNGEDLELERLAEAGNGAYVVRVPVEAEFPAGLNAVDVRGTGTGHPVGAPDDAVSFPIRATVPVID